MAAKVNVLKMLQEIRGRAAISNRLPAPRCPGLLLMQLRALGARSRLRPRKLSITIDPQQSAKAPDPVRIHHM
ncbi:MAG TPA: hypothetical protein PKI20_16855 [Verrucomicrobiota bacterium]|jgi:hypothetical protein|nr:hypothetical protein [Verrucomicrobiota bacterium]HQL79436.1 hypothetical protein [Verrucomicrobiota bacterium]